MLHIPDCAYGQVPATRSYLKLFVQVNMLLLHVLALIISLVSPEEEIATFPRKSPHATMYGYILWVCIVK